MGTPDSTYNLTALGARLRSEQRRISLADKIRRAQDVASLVVDLAMAIESLDALDELLEKFPNATDFQTLIAESALLNNAVVLYSRATKTASDERGGFDLRSRFSEEQKLIHQELSDLRDQAIAHFGSGGSYKGVWQAELVILQRSVNGERVGVITRRQTTDLKLSKRARTQIQAALELMSALRAEKIHDVTRAMSEAAAADPDFGNEVLFHPLNLDAFLSSNDAANSARSAVDTGYAQGSVKHR